MLDEPQISQKIYFKGGTCAAMLGYLDRFSVDLDFDLKEKADKKTIHHQLSKIFSGLDLVVKQKARNSLFYVLQYPQKTGRNNMKLSVVDSPFKSGIYKPEFLTEINRYAVCQTKETMFAHKLVAILDRYNRYKTIAGRDIYDVHHFFIRGFTYNSKLIKERTRMEVYKYLAVLQKFISEKVTDKQISQDLNFLLPPEKFKKTVKILKKEVLMFLQNELTNLKKVKE
jgi:predicted nucleotidyltransferase component of viral defense system